MTTLQLREALFREMNPMLDSDVMLHKMLAYVRSLLTEQPAATHAVAAEKKYKARPVPPEVGQWSGCISFTDEEIESDPRLKAILSK